MTLLPANPRAGIPLAFAAFFLFSLMDVAIKWLSAGYPLPQVVLFNSLMGLLPLALYAWYRGGLKAVRTRNLPGQVLRALFGLASGYTAFFAYTMMPLADAYAIMFAAPLFITALSVPMLGEKVGWRRWTAVLIGFLGVMVMLRPGSGGFDLALLLPVASALLYGISVLIVRRMGPVDPSAAFVFHGNLIGVAGSAVLLLFTGALQIAAADLPVFLVMGLFNGAAMICIVTAYRVAPAAVVAPFQYTQMLWAVVYGSLIWGDWPHLTVWIGSAIVLASGIYIFHREAVRGGHKERTA
ncbi:MAG: DMT family transporter [Thalassobaculales bacterium]